jgi:spermidine synthase
MIEIAKNEFKLKEINYFNLDVIEAVNILSNKKKNKYDTIFIDVYDENSKVPEIFLKNDFIENITSLLLNN